MHRIALNTILIAVRHGRGTGLEVLAENTAATAGEISAICEEADRLSRQLIVDLREAIDGFAKVVVQGREIAGLMERDGTQRQGEFHALRDSTLQALDDLGQEVESARQLASEMKLIDLNPLCRDILPDVEHAIEDLAFRANELCRGIRAEENTGGLLEELSAQYTMANERETHAQLFSPAEASPGGGEAEPDGVELF